MSWDCRERKYSNNSKKFEKAEKAIDGDKDNLVLCLLTTENKKESVKKKGWCAEDVKQPFEAGMMSTIDGDTFCLFTKNTSIGDFGALCDIMNNDTNLFNIIDINQLIQGSSGIMPATKGKLCQYMESQWD